MNPDFSRLSAEQLNAFVHKMLVAIGSGASNPYGLDPAIVTQLGGFNASLGTSILTTGQRKDAYRAALSDRLANEAATASVAALVTRLVLANPGLSDAQLATLGLSRPSRSRTRIVPQTVTNVTASVLANDAILVRFGRNGNPSGVVFQIEAQTGSGWETAAITTTTRATLSGYAPGAPVAFRVIATKNGQASLPSREAVPYGASIAPALRLAA